MLTSDAPHLQIRYWRQSENRYLSQDVDARKKTDFVVDNLDQNTMYELRVLGYSRGGDGLMSSPIIQFVLGKDCYVREGTTYSCATHINALTPCCGHFYQCYEKICLIIACRLFIYMYVALCYARI